jgi:hypothetical protein
MVWRSIRDFDFEEHEGPVLLLVQNLYIPERSFITVGEWCTYSHRFDAWHEIVHDEKISHFCELLEVPDDLIGIIPE